MRNYVEIILKQVIDDLMSQFHTTNDAFRRRIEECKEAKTKLEVQHSENQRQVNEMLLKCQSLQKSLANKEGYMALAHTRMGNRCQRPGVELCRDLVESNLVNEVFELRKNCSLLQQALAEVSISFCYKLYS